MSTLSKFGILVGSALLGVSANFSSAAILTFTNRTSFESALQGFYFENFDSFVTPAPQAAPSGVSFSSGAFSYTVTAEQVYNGQPSAIGLYNGVSNLGVAAANERFSITLTSPTRAIGGQFFFLSEEFIFVGGASAERTVKLTLTFDDNSTFVVPDYNPTSVSNSYRGFALDYNDTRKITKLSFTPNLSNFDGYATGDTITVGSTAVIPESSSYGLVFGLAGLVCYMSRRRRY